MVDVERMKDKWTAGIVSKPQSPLREISESFDIFLGMTALFLSTRHLENARRSILPLPGGTPSSSWLLRSAWHKVFHHINSCTLQSTPHCQRGTKRPCSGRVLNGQQTERGRIMKIQAEPHTFTCATCVICQNDDLKYFVRRCVLSLNAFHPYCHSLET